MNNKYYKRLFYLYELNVDIEDHIKHDFDILEQRFCELHSEDDNLVTRLYDNYNNLYLKYYTEDNTIYLSKMFYEDINRDVLHAYLDIKFNESITYYYFM